RQLLDDFCRVLGAGRLNHRQIETVAGKARQRLPVFDKLNQKGRRTTGASRPAIEIAQQRGLMFTAKKDFWIALGEVRRDRRQTYKGAKCIHRIESLPQKSAWQVRGNTEPAL